MFLIKVGLEYFSYQCMKGTLFCDNLMFFVIAEMMMTGIIEVKISIKAKIMIMTRIVIKARVIAYLLNKKIYITTFRSES